MKKAEENAEISTSSRQLKKVKDDRPYDFDWHGLVITAIVTVIILLAIVATSNGSSNNSDSGEYHGYGWERGY